MSSWRRYLAPHGAVLVRYRAHGLHLLFVRPATTAAPPSTHVCRSLWHSAVGQRHTPKLACQH